MMTMIGKADIIIGTARYRNWHGDNADKCRLVQTLSSREISPLDSIVVSVTMMKAGETHNVIPDSTWLGGTLRALRLATFEYSIERLQNMAASIAHAHRCNVTVSWDQHPIYPPTVNSPQAWDFARGIAIEYVAAP
jgi:metal-dependent amidase/aminoacylase/carboxypeptidase family protein